MDNSSKIQTGLNKGKEKVELLKEKSKLNKVINDAQVNKSKLLLQMGLVTYQKIREEIIEDSDFDEISEQILQLDKVIFENNIKIEDLYSHEFNRECECGYILEDDDKFCSKCGKNVEIKSIDEEVSTCMFCDNEIEVDSNFCICCGKKVKKINNITLEK